MIIMFYKYLSLFFAFTTAALACLSVNQRIQVVSAEAEARNAKVWATETRNQKEYRTIFPEVYENLNPADRELVRSFIFWGFSKPNRGLDEMVKKFDKEYPQNQYWSLRQTMIETWNRDHRTEVYNEHFKVKS